MGETNITSIVTGFAIMIFFIATGVFIITNTLTSYDVADDISIQNEHYLTMKEEIEKLSDDVENEIDDPSFFNKAKSIATDTLDTVTLGATKSLRKLGNIKEIFVSANKWIKSVFAPFVPDIILSYLWIVLLLIFSMLIIGAWLRYKP